MATTRPAGPRQAPIWNKHVAKMLFYRDPIAYHTELYRTYGRLASFAYGSTKIAAYGPVYNHQVMSQPDLFETVQIAPPGNSSVVERLSTGLPNANGPRWRRERRLLLPAFHRQHIAKHVADIGALAQAALDTWPCGAVSDIAAQARTLARSVSSTLLFGWRAGAQDSAFAESIERWLALSASAAVQLAPLNVPGAPFRSLVRLSEQVERRLRGLIQERRAAPERHDDMLSLLLQARDEDGSQLSDDELIGQANVLFVAGFETTAMALTWTLFLLAQHPLALADVVDELSGVLGGGPPTAEQFGSLPLLDRVIKESLRLLPPATQGVRAAAAEFEMGGYSFPAGTKVLFSQYITHHMAELYPEPQRFLPERWAAIAPSPYEYLPFLAGPRTCIGVTFAQTELKIVLALILQRFRLEMAPGATIDRKVQFTLVPKHGMPMRIERQDRQFRKVAVRGNIHEMVDLA